MKLKMYRQWIALGVSFLLLLTLFMNISYRLNRSSKTLRIVVVQKATDENNDFWQDTIRGAKMAAQEYDVDLTITGPTYEKMVSEHHEMILEAIEQKPDAIVLTPTRYEETLPYARKIEEAKIPLIIMDSVMAEPAGKAIVATDNVEGGRKMGEFMKQFVTETSVIGVVGHVEDSSTARERLAGFKEGLGSEESRIAEVVYCDSDYEKAYDITVKMLQNHPEMDIIAGLNENAAVGAARAVVALGLQDKVHMIGFDSSMEEIRYLENGIFEAIVIQRPINMGYLAVEQAVKAARGEATDAYTDSGSVLVTRDTIYSDENEKLLFPV